jgi:hypothetical protein
LWGEWGRQILIKTGPAIHIALAGVLFAAGCFLTEI